MGLKFTLTAAILQLLFLVLFSVLVDYSNHALPPHKHEGASGTAKNISNAISNNDIAVYYPSKNDFLLLRHKNFQLSFILKLERRIDCI